MPKSTTTKNAGELSEIYSVAYILGNQIIDLVDGNLTPTGSKLKFLKVLRGNGEYTFIPDKKILIKIDDQLTDDVRQEQLKDAAKKLLTLISQKNKDVGAPEVQNLLALLHTDSVSAKNSQKQDFSALIKSDDVPAEQLLGFSVKSQLGSPATLINASKENSAFQYQIYSSNGRPIETQEEIKEIDRKFDGSRLNIAALIQAGYKLQFTKTKRTPLEYNLRMMDSAGPELIALLLLERFYHKTMSSTLAELVHSLCHSQRSLQSPYVRCLGDTPEEREKSLSYKIQNILLGFATGAMPSEKWDGKDRAAGGFIVVKQDGNVVCLELYTRNAIGQYLINNTRFEDPSRSRHNWDILYTEEEELLSTSTGYSLHQYTPANYQSTRKQNALPLNSPHEEFAEKIVTPYVDLQFQVRFKK